MQNKLLDGKSLSEKIIKEIRATVLDMDEKPGLAAILVGDDPSSHLYVRLKKKACDFCNVHFSQYLFNDAHSDKDVIEAIEFLNKDPQVHGILVQLPLPAKFNTDKIIAAIDPKKDVDGFHPENVKRLGYCATKNNGTVPTLPFALCPLPFAATVSPLVLGIVELIKETKEIIENKKIVILCNHKIFGAPFHCFYGKNNDITIITPASTAQAGGPDEDYKTAAAEADVLIVSVGRPNFIKARSIKQDAIVIDVGINKVDDELVGDVDFRDALNKVKFITPVPGGVGPMTIAMLLRNLIMLASESRVESAKGKVKS